MIYNFLIFFFLLNIILHSQSIRKEYGIITFITSENFYAKFPSTEEIQIDDTLYFVSNDKKAGIVKLKSLNSVYATIVNDVALNDSIYMLIKTNQQKIIDKDREETILLNTKSITTHPEEENYDKKSYILQVSLQSYGYINRYKDLSKSKIRTTYSNKNFLDENLSFDFNGNYLFHSGTSKTTTKDIKENFKIFNLQLLYKTNYQFDIYLGRTFNPLIRGIDLIDGIQVIKFGKNENYGAIIGSRPNLKNYWFNLKLLQTGLFYSRIDSLFSKTMQNSIGFFEQTNDLKSDRRFIFLEHSNSFIPNTNLLFFSEIDFYNITDGQIEREINVTSFYSAVNINFSKAFNLNLSYDKRKNIFHLNDYRNNIDSIINNNFRNGLRVSLSYAPIREIRLTTFYNQSKTNGEKNLAQSGGIVIYYNSDLLFNSSFNLFYSYYNSTFIKGDNYSVTFNKDFSDWINFSLSYKHFYFKSQKKSFSTIDKIIETGFFINLFNNYNLYFQLEKNLVKRNFDNILIEMSYKI